MLKPRPPHLLNHGFQPPRPRPQPPKNGLPKPPKPPRPKLLALALLAALAPPNPPKPPPAAAELLAAAEACAAAGVAIMVAIASATNANVAIFLMSVMCIPYNIRLIRMMIKSWHKLADHSASKIYFIQIILILSPPNQMLTPAIC
ncbi:hypothetical protein RCIX1250 [Methanocella arvoryzae MRE50]|uniref:Uncharacterized protein n=1 Tax=Methanocella arvoryzae (strain DSM 22066 / NBRC 105507 / MRE50) TaxID=351160 RepID=Q0W4Z3_METAR|nr:hypothetical protein RCIX1250 [Methanocella arvoryzae MRE50]